MGPNTDEKQKHICQHANTLIQRTLQGQPEQRNEAFGELAERYIKPLANRVAFRRRFPEALVEEFVPDAITFVWEKLSQFDPQAGCFSAWSYRVLYHFAIDWGRRLKRERQLFVQLPVPEASEDELPWLETVPDDKQRDIWEQVSANEPLSYRQLEILRKLPPLRRAIACAAAGLVGRIPREVWTAWLHEADLEEDFPPPEIADYDEPLDRLRCLAEYLGMPFDTLRQHWYRAREILQELFSEG